MKNLAREIKGDKSLWERMIVPEAGEMLLVEDSYYDGIVEDVQKLQQEIERLKAFHEYFRELYGQGLEVANWHLNGDLEPFDDFFNSAEEEMDK